NTSWSMPGRSACCDGSSACRRCGDLARQREPAGLQSCLSRKAGRSGSLFFAITLAGPTAMLDVAFIREHLQAVKDNCQNRGVRADADRVVALDDERKRLVSEAQVKQQRANEVQKLVPKEKDPEAKQQLIAEGKTLRAAVDELEKKRKQVEE